MRAHVLVFPQQGESLLAAWMYYSESRRARSSSGAGDWETFCEEEVRRALRGDLAGSSVFICLLGDGLSVTPDEHLLEQILGDIKRFGWGPLIYLVTTRRQPSDRQLAENRGGLESFFAAALRNRVQGVLQTVYNPKGGEEEDPAFFKPADLWRAANRFRGWRQLSHSDYALSAPRRPWRCLFPEETELLGRVEGTLMLLRDLVQSWQEECESNLLVLVDTDATAADQQVRTVERARRRFAGREIAVATLRARASSNLHNYCRSHQLGTSLALEGVFELWYLLLRLNHGLTRERQAVSLGSRLVEAVEFTGPPPLPTSGSALRLPGLLISSAFDPAEPAHCHAASADAGALLQLAPLALPYLVARTLNPLRFAALLQQDPPPRIWVHAGHGEGHRGLQTSPFGQFVEIDEWVACLRARNVPLDLVILLTCESAEIARRFAEAGIGVSIGFRGEVPTTTPGRLAEEVLKSVFSRGLTPATALDGFVRGVDLLRGLGGSAAAEPRAYYSVLP